MNKIDMLNKKIGKLTVEKNIGRKGHNQLWECKCECGNVTQLTTAALNRPTLSCGCLTKEKLKLSNIKHGYTNTPVFCLWQDIKKRCYNPKSSGYKNYGGRGIIVCDEWLNDSKAFIDYVLSIGYKEGLTIDRINNNGNYEKGNIRFVTRKEQNNNKRSNILCKGIPLSLYLEKIGLKDKYNKIYDRIKRYKWDLDEAIRVELLGVKIRHSAK